VAVSRRSLLIAGGAGLGAAAVSVFGGTWIVGALDDEPRVDGDVLLDEPGVYQEPLDDVNDDVTGEPLPDVALVDADGNEVRLSTYRGEPLVVNVWFSNCPPCQRELADFATVHAEVGDRVRFLGVDPFDTVEAMRRFADRRGVTYDLLRDPEQAFTTEIGVVAYPVTLFVDARGMIVRQTGAIDADQLRDAIAELF
jgi:peroxiredoxin